MTATAKPSSRSAARPPVRHARRPSFARNVGWGVAGNAGYALCQWLVLVVVARLGTPSMVGDYALGLAVGAPLVLLANLSLRTVLVTDTGREHPFQRYLRVRAGGMAVAMAAICTAVWIFDLPAAVVVLVGLAKAFDGVGDIYLGLLQRHHDQRAVAVAQLVNGALTIGLTALLLAATGSIAWAAAGSAMGSLIAWLGCCAPLASRVVYADARSTTPRRHTHRFSPPGSGALVWTALPLGLASGITSLTANVPRYALQDRLGAAALGAFAAAGYLVLTGNVLVSAVAQTLLPRLVDLRAAGARERFAALVRQSLIGVTVAGVLAVWAADLFGATVLRTVYGEQYAGDAGTLTVLTVATAVAATCFVLDAALSVVRRFTGQLAVNAAVLVAATLAALALVPRYGITGAAWATAAAAAVHAGLKWELLRRDL
ncbi:lipopolysaccharide biosynthesis protein [Dactylosporangium sp. NPDC049525]|uniref:lipopolysaccharide biosynthesis protein n=1 Tax=Dactylosporangium sp. NPDC049525 TaxID=3154730 RepID=UPI00342506C8